MVPSDWLYIWKNIKFYSYIIPCTKYISDGDVDKVVIPANKVNLLNDTEKEIKTY